MDKEKLKKPERKSQNKQMMERKLRGEVESVVYFLCKKEVTLGRLKCLNDLDEKHTNYKLIRVRYLTNEVDRVMKDIGAVNSVTNAE